MTYTAAGWGADRFGPGVYGWAGAGGSLFVWVPRLRLSLAYVPNLAASRLSKPRAERLLLAAIQAAEARVHTSESGSALPGGAAVPDERPATPVAEREGTRSTSTAAGDAEGEL